MKKWKITSWIFHILLLFSFPALAEQGRVIINNISPQSGTVGTQVNITGEFFSPQISGNQVLLNGISVPVINASPNSLRITIPSGATSGRFVVRVGRIQATSQQTFTVTEQVAIISFSPQSGNAGTTVSINGTGFSRNPNEDVVNINGVVCNIVAASPTQLRVIIPQNVSSGHFEVIVNGVSRAMSNTPFQVTGATNTSNINNGRPVIESFSPLSGPPGTIVRIIGRNFSSQDQVWLSGKRLDVTNLLPNSIEVTIPQGVQSGRIVIRGRYTVESNQSFTVQTIVSPPVITNFSPTEAVSGTKVTIFGQNFSNQSFENRVLLSGQPLVVEQSSSTRIVVIIPPDAQSGHFTVSLPGAGEARSNNQFTVLQHLKIQSISPEFGGPRTNVTINGTGFSPNKRDTRVSINGIACKIISSSPTQMVIEIPARATSGNIRIEIRGQDVQTIRPFRIILPPEITRFTPEAGNEGTQVTIYGNNFGTNLQNIKVRLNNNILPINAIGPRQIIVTIPHGVQSGRFSVIIRDQGEEIFTESTRPFTIYEAIKISSFNPPRGPIDTNVTIKGSGFSPELRENKIFIAGVQAKILASGPNEIIAKVSRGAVKGPVRVDVLGRGSAQSTQEFIVEIPPVITKINPQEGIPGSQITIYGDRFGTAIGQVKVSLNGRPCQIDAVGNSQIILRVPEGATSGRFQITVFGQGSTESPQIFNVLSPLTIAGFSPTSGIPGTVVSITGTGFPTGRNAARTTIVKIGNTNLRILSINPNEIRVVIPPEAQSGRFQILLPSNQNSFISSQTFRVEVGVMVDRFFPTEGSPDTQVTIEGRGFVSKGLRVSLGNKVLPRPEIISDKQLRVTIPRGANSGNFVVSIPGVGEARSQQVFNVLPPLRIDSIEPTKGFSGSTVIIKGSGFQPDIRLNDVKIGNVPLMVEVASVRELQVRIPPNATTGPIFVTVSGRNTVSSKQRFTIINSPPPGFKVPPPPPGSKVPPPPSQNKVLPPPPPQQSGDSQLFIQSFTPEQGVAGTEITIYGGGFGNDPSQIRVWIGNIMIPVLQVNPNQIRARIIPDVVTGNVRIWRVNGSSIQTPNNFIRR